MGGGGGSHNKGLNTGTTGAIHSLGLERERDTYSFIPDVNKTKQKIPQTFTYSLAPEGTDQLQPESESRATMRGGSAKGSRKDIPEEAPLGTFPALSSAAPGAAWPPPPEQAGSQNTAEYTRLRLGEQGPRGRHRFVWRGLNHKQLNGEKAEDPDALTTPREIATPPAGPGKFQLWRPGGPCLLLGIPAPDARVGRRRAPALCRGVVGFDCPDTKHRLVLNSACSRCGPCAWLQPGQLLARSWPQIHEKGSPIGKQSTRV